MQQEQETAVGVMETLMDGDRQHEREDKDNDLSKGPGVFVLPLRLWLHVNLDNSNNYVQPMAKH